MCHKAQKEAYKKGEQERRLAGVQADDDEWQETQKTLAAQYIPQVEPPSAIEAPDPNVSNVTVPAAAADTASITTVSITTTESTSGWSSAANASSRTLSSTESPTSSVVGIQGTVTPTDKTAMSASIKPISAASEQA